MLERTVADVMRAGEAEKAAGTPPEPEQG